jgi:hypothetical protein
MPTGGLSWPAALAVDVGARHFARHVYSVNLYLRWLPDYLQTARGLSFVTSRLFTSIPFLIGGAMMILTNWIGDRILTHQTMHRGARRIVVAACLLLCAIGMAIPFVDSLTLVIILI